MSKCTPEAQQLVKSLLSQPENAVCADCKKGASKWASSTLGIFICYECSGIHRSLGTHISFVRSCTLDGWTNEQARLMKRVGNHNANEYWEARLPPDFMRPSPYDRLNMEAFIRAKYAERRWVGEGEPPNLRKRQPMGMRQQLSPPISLAQSAPMSMSQDIRVTAPIYREPETPSAFDFIDAPKPGVETTTEGDHTETSPIVPHNQVNAGPSSVRRPMFKKKVNESSGNVSDNSDSSFDFINDASKERRPSATVTASRSRKPKGLVRFMKKPTGDQVLDQMISSRNEFRPVSAPVKPQSAGALSMFDGLDFSKKINN